MVDAIDRDGVKTVLPKGAIGYDDYAPGGDVGRIYIGTGTVNIPLAKKDDEATLGTPIASAATTTIGTAGLGDYIHITGTTTITSFGTASTAGIRRTLIFDGVLTLTHNATSLICVGDVSIVTVAGMVIEVVAETTANWRVVSITHPSISATELGYLDNVASNIQAQFNSKATDSNTVHKTGDETIAGVKTFSSSPIVPTPTANTQAANKAYVDNEILQATSTEVYAGPYGLNWDETNDVYLRTGSTNYKAIQSLMRRCVMNDNGTVNYYLHPHNSNYKADGTAADLTGASGNVMVEVPKFYYKYNYNTVAGVVHEHSISLTPLDGYTVHDAFVRGGVEKANRYYPAYLGYSTGSKLLSRSGVYPKVDQTRAQFRTLARANGAGWEQIDFLLYEAITLLMVIEYGTMNIQSALGQGRTALTGGSLVGGSLIGINGLSNGVGNGTANVTYAGSADDAAADGSFMTYRGCENFFGNVWRFVDGINCNGSNSKLVYLNMNPATYADSVITGDYVSVGVTSAAASGYTRKLGNTRKGFIATDITGGTSANGTTDYYYASTTVDTLAFVGGAANNGLYAGPLDLNVGTDPSYSNVFVGAGVSR